MKAISRLGTIAVLLLTTLLMSGTAQAKTITVDGDPTDWAAAPTQGILVTDPDEGTVLQNLDIGDVYFTNDTANLYFRIDTLAGSNWASTTLVVCLNVDNAATGSVDPVCNNAPGMDYIVTFQRSGTNLSPLNIIDFLYCVTGTCTDALSRAGTVGARQLPNGVGTVTEIGIPLNLLRQTDTLPTGSPNGLPASCTAGVPCDLPTQIILGNPAAEPDDEVTLLIGPTVPRIPAPPTPITLTSFTATAGAAGVDLAWATASELNVLGYNIYRGTSDDRTAATKISPSLIAATGDGVSGASYSWADSSAAAGTIYRYWLEVVDTDGTTEEYGPVALAPEVAALSPRLYLPLIQR